MEVLIVLFSLGLLIAISVTAIVLFVRVAQLTGQLRELEERVSGLDSRVGALSRREKAAPLPEQEVREVRAPGPPAAPTAAPPPVSPVIRPPAPTPVLAAPQGPPAPIVPKPTSAAPQPSAPPPIPPPPSEPTPPEPGFDWESLLGIRGAAWLGGIAVLIAAILFAKLAFDRHFFTPEMQIAVLVLGGVGCLVGAEISLRRGYETTANAVSGAGIAVLYAAFFAAHALYGLIGLAPTFALMAVVTAVACVLAIRYDAFSTAVLGLLGGFATPVALSTGQDRPIGLFSYILLLNVGLASVALKKRWHGLVLLALGGTFLIELGWFSRFFSAQNTLVGLIAFLLFGLLYLLLPLVSGQTGAEESEQILRAGALGGVAPFLFAVLIAGNPRYAGEWPLLFGFVGLLLAALAAIGLLRGRPALLVSGALATAITLPLWAINGLTADNALLAALAATLIAAIGNCPVRVGLAFGVGGVEQKRSSFEIAGLLAGTGLGLFALMLAAKQFSGPPWPFVLSVAALLAILLERSRDGGIKVTLPAGALAVAVLIQIWFFASTGEATLVRNLALPSLFTLGLSIAAAVRAKASGADAFTESAVVVASVVATLGLCGCLMTRALGADPLPLFAALALAAALVVASSLRSAWGGLMLGALLASALFTGLWQEEYLHAGDASLLLAIGLAFYLAFLVLPFAVPDSLAAAWKGSAWPWVASALSGAFFFVPIHQVVVRGWGKAWIGALPVAMAAITVAALQGVGRRFPGGHAVAARDRLRYLALFAAVALGFIATAIPLQLDRQWITVGWALEAMAVWWLFERLPHPGLRVFGAILFGAVGARLLLNPEIFRYQPRGWPILNWLLYTYGVAAVSCLLGARVLARAEGDAKIQAGGVAPTKLPQAVALLGLLLIFALINLEIADYFSPAGGSLALYGERSYARDLVTSLAWGLYAMSLLVVGVWRRVPALRHLSLAFLLLTVVKVFLYDLANVGGIYRIFSFLGLGVCLILVSLFYQRFVYRKQAAS